ncbi:MAG TPA: MBL fold metallo-hydrolase [Acidimicrobiales bacterium]|jgi:ribonuclease BN (tRNA processing enzyme)|nr:MBL fold metallo-hydrolase [Acidimicrobiales bacterium]
MSDPSAGDSQPGGLSVLVLGCDGSWPGPGGAGSGYLVRSTTTSLLLDAGPGTFANLQRFGDAASLDAIILSHHHPDHWTDLYGLAVHAEFITGRTGIPVFAPEGLAPRAHLEASTVFDWHTVADGLTIEAGDLTVGFHRTDHGVETLAVRLDGGGRSLGYSADSGPGWPLTDLGSGLDLVLCEATYTTDHEGTAGHMSGRQAGEQARRADARRLVLTHRWPTIEPAAVVAEAEATFGLPVEQAVIGKEFRL